jgi:hypothetical protein
LYHTACIHTEHAQAQASTSRTAHDLGVGVSSNVSERWLNGASHGEEQRGSDCALPRSRDSGLHSGMLARRTVRARAAAHTHLGELGGGALHGADGRRRGDRARAQRELGGGEGRCGGEEGGEGQGAEHRDRLPAGAHASKAHQSVYPLAGSAPLLAAAAKRASRVQAPPAGSVARPPCHNTPVRAAPGGSPTT